MSNEMRDINIACDYASGMTHSDVGRKYGLSSQRCRQIYIRYCFKVNRVLRQGGDEVVDSGNEKHKKRAYFYLNQLRDCIEKDHATYEDQCNDFEKKQLPLMNYKLMEHKGRVHKLIQNIESKMSSYTARINKELKNYNEQLNKLIKEFKNDY